MSKSKFIKRFMYNGSSLVADLIMLIIYILALPRMISVFEQKSYFTAAIIIVMYLVFCTSVLMIRKLYFSQQSSGQKRDWLAFFALFFGVFITYVIVDSAGLFSRLDSLPTIINGKFALLVLLGVIFCLLLTFMFMTVVLIKMRPFHSMTNYKGLLIEFFCTLSINMMIITITAYWNSSFTDVEPYDDLTLGGKILIFLVTYLFFLLFFAPPRMLFLLKKKKDYSSILFFVSIGYFVWDSLSRIAW